MTLKAIEFAMMYAHLAQIDYSSSKMGADLISAACVLLGFQGIQKIDATERVTEVFQVTT